MTIVDNSVELSVMRPYYWTGNDLNLSHQIT